MKVRKTFWLGTAGLLFFLFSWATPARPEFIGLFDGLDSLIDRADAIAVIRIDEHIDNRISPSFTTTHKCYVYQTLKGDIPAGHIVRIRLLDFMRPSEESFEIGSTYLVFFNKRPKGREGIEYDSLHWQGANIKVSPYGNEKMPDGNSVKEKIHSLIKTYVVYRDQKIKGEDVFLQKMLQ